MGDDSEVIICDDVSEEEGKLFFDESDSFLSSFEKDSDKSDDDDDDDVEYITSRDGTKWRKTPPSTSQRTLQ